jgi:hypothetical protein
MLTAFGLGLPPAAVLRVLLVVNVGIGAGTTPGNAGVYEILVATALGFWGIPREVGLAVGLAQHAVEILPVLAVSVAAFVGSGPRMLSAMRAASASSVSDR